MTSPSTSVSTSTVYTSSSANVNALLGGVKWGGPTGTGASVSFSFPWTTLATATFSGPEGNGYSLLNEPNASFHAGLTAAQQAAARGALQGWANVANVAFNELAESSSNVGDIRFAFTSATYTSTMGQAWGWGALPSTYWPMGGDIWISTLASGANPATPWSPGSDNYVALQHEIGHALGLKHSFEQAPVLPLALESRQYTVMSYTAPSNNLFLRVTANPDGSYAFKYITVEPETPMLYDIAAMQFIYGPNLSYKAGDDVYTFDTRTPFLKTLWDAGGTDTLSVANFSKACAVDLRPGHFSKISIESDPVPRGYGGGTAPTYDGTDNLAIAFGCVIENAIGGSGNDLFRGNEANNSLDGGAGLDTVAFTGNRASYTLSLSGSTWTVRSTAEGVDTLIRVERLSFADKTVALDLSGSAGQAYRIYQAAFNRTPDNGGLKYWIDQMDHGTSLSSVAAGFVSSLEFQALYGSNPGNADFLTRLYSNVLHRTPDPAGYGWWLGQLNTGAYSKTTALVSFSESAENQVGVIGVIQNGIEWA